MTLEWVPGLCCAPLSSSGKLVGVWHKVELGSLLGAEEAITGLAGTTSSKSALALLFLTSHLYKASICAPRGTKLLNCFSASLSLLLNPDRVEATSTVGLMLDT